MALLILFAMMCGAMILVPLVLLKVFVQLGLGLIALPFRLLGGLLHLFAALFGGVARLMIGGGVLVAMALGIAAFAILIPLLPFVMAAGLLWLIVRAFEPRHVVRYR